MPIQNKIAKVLCTSMENAKTVNTRVKTQVIIKPAPRCVGCGKKSSNKYRGMSKSESTYNAGAEYCMKKLPDKVMTVKMSLKSRFHVLPVRRRFINLNKT